MYIDESIPIPASTPDYLLEDFKKLKELYDSTEKNHDLYWEGGEASIKAAYLDGTIS